MEHAQGTGLSLQDSLLGAVCTRLSSAKRGQLMMLPLRWDAARF